MYLIALWLSLSAQAAEPVKVGIIDTGVVGQHRLLRPFTYVGKKFLGYDFVRQRADAEDTDGHGTHLAGVITLEQEPGSLKLYAYRFSVGTQVFTDAGKRRAQDAEDEALYLQAVKRAAADEVAVLNLSLMHPHYLAEEEALFKAMTSTLIVVGAGNDRLDLDHTPSYPCAYDLPNVLCVGAADNTHTQVSTFSNFGSPVKLYAPGETIIGFSLDREEFLKTMSGTSQATAVVTRLAVALKRQYPQASPSELRAKLLQAKVGIFLTTLPK